jgi:hypothetical protein
MIVRAEIISLHITAGGDPRLNDSFRHASVLLGLSLPAVSNLVLIL